MKTQLWDVTKRLAAVAAGREPAETVIINGRLVNVNTGEIMENTGVAIACGRIALVGDAGHTIGESTTVIDAAGRYVTPGFMDGHTHVESSMMTVREYARAVMPRGTTAIFADPHEIANVFGTAGVRFMLEDGRGVPMRFFVAMPSCVPAVAAFEDAGAAITPEDVEAFMGEEMVCGLGEVMNYPGVLAGDGQMHREIAATLRAGKTVTGHYPAPETGRGLNGYIASGARCCHESARWEDALAKMRLGMYAQIREGSAWRDLKDVIRAVTERRIDTRFATLVSDDTHPDTLIRNGHMDHIVRRAIQEGVDPLTAIAMVTINTAHCYGMDRDLGSVSPGKVADILILSDLTNVTVDQVLIGGELVAENGALTAVVPPAACPEWVKNSVKLKAPLTAGDFVIHSPAAASGRVNVRAIEIMEAKAGTRERRLALPVQDGVVLNDPAQDVIKAAVVERHKATGSIGKGFVKGFGLTAGAVASTVAHDAHNLMIVGTNDEDMAVAGNVLAACGGGMAAVRGGETLAVLRLPVAGIMCELPAADIADAVARLDAAWKELGCGLISPFMTMALIALAVIPEIRLTNRGLVDTVNFRMTELFPETEDH